MELVRSIDLKSMSKWNIASIWIFAIGCFLMITVLNAFILYPPTSTWFALGLLVPCLVVVTVVHEGLHGIAFKKFTGKVRFGGGWSGSLGLVFYATSPGGKLTRTKMLITALIPQLLTIVCLLLFLFFRIADGNVAYILLVIAGLNLGGGSADIWLVFQMCRFPSGYIYEDTMTGTAIYRASS